MARVIRAKYGDNAKLLVVNHTYRFAMKEFPTEIDNLCKVEIYDENENTGQDWRGYNPHWNRLLADIQLRTVHLNLRNDMYFEGFHTCEARTKHGLFRWSTGESILHLEEYGGCKCTLSFLAPFPMELEIFNVYGEVLDYITLSGNTTYVFDITHKTRFIKIKTEIWQPKRRFGTKDCRQLGFCLEGIEVERPIANHSDQRM